MMNDKHIRIHGDNIVECERSLNMIYEAIGGIMTLLESPIFHPIYLIETDDYRFRIELLSGHSRWGINIGSYLIENGGVLREGADSYISEVKGNTEKVLLAVEYCSALPAGNNAWQRNGRALSSVLAGVPYLFMAELGGVELNAFREVISPRNPNPLVPFSYLTTTQDYCVPCVPVYCPHPSISEELFQKFESVFGYKDGLKVIRGLLNEDEISESIEILIGKSLRLSKLLSEKKKETVSLKGAEWEPYLKADNRAEWIINNSDLVWSKKISQKVKAPERILSLLLQTKALSLNTIGASDLPICLIPVERIGELEKILITIYPNTIIELPKDKPLAVVWITGYKPKGDDSRPDRGLCPLAKMVMGDSCRMIAIVYGPAKPQTWKSLERGLDFLASNNGLWQSIYRLCDGVFIDCVTKNAPEYIPVKQSNFIAHPKLIIPYYANYELDYSEHDVDTAIHQILMKSGLRECLCNPPGGDWSGISYYHKGEIYRWTSLPRVSDIGGKRPDHVFQKEYGNRNLFLSIESKGKGSDLEDKIGVKLTAYLHDLFSMVPTSVKRENAQWRLYNKRLEVVDYEILSVGAFVYKNDKELNTHIERGQLDCVMAFEFKSTSILHILSNEGGRIIEKIVKKALGRIGGIEIKIH